MPKPVCIQQLTRVELPSAGPEDVFFHADDAIYTGTRDGWIFRIEPGGNDIARLANTGGIPSSWTPCPMGACSSATRLADCWRWTYPPDSWKH